MSKAKDSKTSIRAPRRGSKEHDEAIEAVERLGKYSAFHVRLTPNEAKILKQKLLDLDMTGTKWLRQFINS